MVNPDKFLFHLLLLQGIVANTSLLHHNNNQDLHKWECEGFPNEVQDRKD